MVLALREVDIGQVFQDVSVIHGGVAIGDLDMAPAFERSKHHEEVGGAVALVLVVETGRASRFHRDRHARLGNELLRGLVQANQRAIGDRVAACRRPARLPWRLRTRCWPSAG